MYKKKIQALSEQGIASSLTKMKRGIEKESLRVTPEGRLSQTSHPLNLGSSLTHPSITTDYSESLLEFITQPDESIDATLEQLKKIHGFVYKNINDEILWVNSMPCVVGDNNSIPIAQYGKSNIGKIKTLYRVGLDHRYGRLMQTIAGIHYNLSFPEEFWESYKSLCSSSKLNSNKAQKVSSLSSKDFISEEYFNMIRNFQIFSPLLVYLFGASPAVCASFLKNRNHTLDEFKPGTTYYKPFATSLRMSDLGYQNDAQSGLHISYNSIEDYTSSMAHAISTSYPDYEKIGLTNSGQLKQLSTNILQIENEYYGSIRPKPHPKPGERPTISLQRDGVEYIEMRCLDLNPFEPLGINKEQILFLDSFALYCLLEASPLFSQNDYSIIEKNLQSVVMEGRNPDLEIDTSFHTNNKKTAFSSWALDCLEKIEMAASLLDTAHQTTDHVESVKKQIRKVHQPETTPSALILKNLEDTKSNFFDFAMSTAKTTANYFIKSELNDDEIKYFTNLSKQSLDMQKELETSENIDFNQYLEDYLAL